MLLGVNRILAVVAVILANPLRALDLNAENKFLLRVTKARD